MKRTKEQRRALTLDKVNVVHADAGRRAHSHGSGHKGKPRMARRILSLFLVLVMGISVAFVGIHLTTKAADGSTYANATELTFTNNVYTVPTGGLTKDNWYKYTGNDGKVYVFQASTSYQEADTLTLNSDNTLTWNHDPTHNAVDVTTLTTPTSAGSLQLQINAGQQLKKGTKYYYNVNGTYYTFTPTEDLGFQTLSSRESGESSTTAQGTLYLTLDPTNQKYTLSGDVYTPHVIYEEITSNSDFAKDNVYLIGMRKSDNSGDLNLIKYADTTHYDSNADASTGWFNNSKCPSHAGGNGMSKDGENVYDYVPYDAQSELKTSGTFCDTVGGSETTHSNYFDGLNGTLANDPYVYSEFSTYKSNSTNLLIFGISGLILRGYDGSTGYYSTKKVFGTVASTERSVQGILLMHAACTNNTATISHNNGNFWLYDVSYHAFHNNNTGTFWAWVPGYPYLCFDGTSIYAKTFRKDSNDERTSDTDRYAAYTYIYKMKTVYDKTSPNQDYTVLNSETTSPVTITGRQLENASVTMTYTGDHAVTGKTFPVTFTLKDENGNNVAGEYSDGNMTFTDGVYTTNMANGDTKNITNIPSGYTITTAVTLPDGTSGDQTAYYSSTVGGTAGTTKDTTLAASTSTDPVEIPIVITDTRKVATVSLSYSGDNMADANEAFPIKLVLKDANGTPVSGSYIGTSIDGNAVTYTFDGANGWSYTTGLTNGQNFTLTVPSGYTLTTEVTLPSDDGTQHTAYYSSTIDGTAGTSKDTTISSDKSIPIVLTSQRELVTVQNLTKGYTDTDDYSDKTKLFPLTLTLTDADGSLMSGTFTGTDKTGAATTYTFTNGVCGASLANNEAVGMYLPKGWTLSVQDSETPANYTTGYQNNTDQTTAVSTPLSTEITQNDVKVTVTHTRREIVLPTGISDSSTPMGGILALLLGFAAVCCTAFLLIRRRIVNGKHIELSLNNHRPTIH